MICAQEISAHGKPIGLCASQRSATASMLRMQHSDLRHSVSWTCMGSQGCLSLRSPERTECHAAEMTCWHASVCAYHSLRCAGQCVRCCGRCACNECACWRWARLCAPPMRLRSRMRKCATTIPALCFVRHATRAPMNSMPSRPCAGGRPKRRVCAGAYCVQAHAH